MATQVSQGALATVRVELAGLPTVNLPIGGEGKPSVLGSALRPRVTVVSSGGALLYRAEPYGSPDSGLPWGVIALAVALVIVWLALM